MIFSPRAALNVRVIIDDAIWYDYIKLLAYFMWQIGYKGLIIFIDETVSLYKLPNKVSRDNNYECLLAILNDTLQGKAEYLDILFGATPQNVEDERRGLYGYEALKTRLEDSDIPAQSWHGDDSQSRRQRFPQRARGILRITPESLDAMSMHRTFEFRRLFGDLRYVIIGWRFRGTEITLAAAADSTHWRK